MSSSDSCDSLRRFRGCSSACFPFDLCVDFPKDCTHMSSLAYSPTAHAPSATPTNSMTVPPAHFCSSSTWCSAANAIDGSIGSSALVASFSRFCRNFPRRAFCFRTCNLRAGLARVVCRRSSRTQQNRFVILARHCMRNCRTMHREWTVEAPCKADTLLLICIFLCFTSIYRSRPASAANPNSKIALLGTNAGNLQLSASSRPTPRHSGHPRAIIVSPSTSHSIQSRSSMRPTNTTRAG
ncbi:uncharacterized protein SCHCODRAFT_02331038 [Schizophyllum commune H4-8]|uniref:uncharacterized protein n=1 Tax=Schizophyllum commune (strain H4-8 / FGSC 9210) TaxID=578458 RepID=UPI0021605EAA|nr:uncharacterized protein SCHCODRAFT_02331038 [Schizophyllum commune H4-8]KAI5889846.1 hypothetical protein SCHCODRAFT_02331038 [Schizophyllum commune H4-8]